MEYDIELKSDHTKGFYIWNKPTVFLKDDDDRLKRFKQIKKQTGISPDETWSLNTQLAIFLVPRLKLFKKGVKRIGGHPGCLSSNKEWLKILDKMIVAFEAYIDDDKIPEKYLKKYAYDEFNQRKLAEEHYWNDVSEGIKLFSEYFGALWW